MPKSGHSFRDDQRATEGLPIRLVIAVVVGAAAVALLLPMLGTVESEGEGETELTVEMDEELLTLAGTGADSVTIAVVTTDGQPVEDTTLVVREGSAPLADGPVDVQTGPESNEVTLNVTTAASDPEPAVDVQLDFRTGQNRGTLVIDVIPPPGTRFADEQSNPELVVVTGT